MAPSQGDGHRRVAAAGALVPVAALPGVFVPPMADAFGLPKLLLVTTAAVVGWAAWLLRPPLSKRALERARQSTPDRRPEWAAAAYVAVVAVAAAFSIGRIDSVFGSYERYGGLVPLLVYVALAALLLAVAREQPEVVERFPVAMAVGIVAPAVYVLLQTAGIDFLDWTDAAGNPIRFAAGTMGNPDFAGAWFGIAVPFLAVLLWRRHWTPLVAGVAILDVAALVATRSRGGILAAAIGVGVFTVLERHRLAPAVRRVVVGAGVVATAAVGLLLAAPESARPAVVRESGLLRTESVVERGRQWQAALAAFTERPVLGHGPDTFEFVYPAHRSESDGRTLGLLIADKPHNVLLEKATDTGVLGVLGVAAYLALLVVVARTGLRARADRPPLLSAFLAGAAAYLAQAFVSIDVPPLAAIGWLLLAGVVAVARGPLPDRTPGGTRSSIGRRPVLAGALGALLVLLVPLSADLAAADGRWDRAAERNPTQPAYRYGLAGALERSQGAARATTAFERALAMQPRSVLALVGLARMHTLLRDFEEADRWWRRAAEADPVDWQVHNEWALARNAWANARRGDPAIRRQAAEGLERALAIKPDHLPAWVNLARVRLALGETAAARTAVARAKALDADDPGARAVAQDLERAQGSRP